MNRQSDQQPEGPARARESVPDPPGTAAPPGGSGSPPDDAAAPRPGPPAAAEPAPEAPAPSANAPAEATVTDVTAGRDDRPRPGPQGDISPEQVREHLRRRAIFLRELAEARELRRRVTPHRSRRARIHAALRRRTFRIN
ncbi:hypothetical protein GCM10009546_14090 [Actinomadura livida]|uniref:Uncharacterized protein n=2 Tax=Actinomadura livida TaxID=79909 RepID=A0ABN1DVD8_9ACTN